MTLMVFSRFQKTPFSSFSSMTKHRLWLCFYFSRTKRRPFTAFPLRAKEATSSHVPINHKILCFSLAEKLIFRGLFDSAQKVIRRLIMQSSSLSEAITTLEFSVSLGVEPMVHLLKTLALSLCKKGRVEEAQRLCMVMESYGFVLDKVMYTALINGHSKNGDMKMAMMVFLRMLKLGCEPDKYTYNTLINGFINLGMFDKVRVLHQQMVEFGLEPDGVSYQILICKYCKDHKVDRVLVLEEVEKMMDNGLVPDHVMFFTLINNNPRVLGISLAYKFLRAIAKNGCGIDLSSISSLTSGKVTTDIVLDIHRLTEIVHDIQCLLEEILARNLPLANVAFNIYMIALCLGGNLIDTARLCRDKMATFSLQLSPSAYNSMIMCHYQKGLVEDAKSLVEVMQDEGQVPNQATFLIMINEYCKKGDIQSAFEVLDQMDESGLKPSIAIYDCIIGCLGRKKRINEAHDIFRTMLEAGICPDETMYVTMINALSRNGQAIPALKLFDEMLEAGVQPSHYAYTALISGLVKKKNMREKACAYLDRMIEEGFKPNTVLCTSLMKHFFWNRDPKFAFRLVDLMTRSGVELDLVTYITLVSGVSRNVSSLDRKWLLPQGRYEESKERFFSLLQSAMLPEKKLTSVISQEEVKSRALRLINEVDNSPLMHNLYLCNGIISCFCRTKMMKDAYNRFKLMQNEGLQPNQVTFTILIDGYFRSGEVDCAVTLFNSMIEQNCPLDDIVYNTLIRGQCKHERLIDALSLSYTLMLKKGLAPSKASYENLLSSLCANNWSGDAVKICQDMLANEYVPCTRNLELLLCILNEKEKWDEARFVHDLLLKKRIFRMKTS